PGARKGGRRINQTIGRNRAKLGWRIVVKDNSVWYPVNRRYAAAALCETVIDLRDAAPDRGLTQGSESEPRNLALDAKLDIPGSILRRSLAIESANCIRVMRVIDAEGAEHKQAGRDVLDRCRSAPFVEVSAKAGDPAAPILQSLVSYI